MPKVILVEPQEATVDDLVLDVSSEENATGYELDDDQVKRLKAAPGVKLKVAGEDEDPVDKLSGPQLDRALAAAKIDVPADASPEDKRAALKGGNDTQEGDSK